MTQEISDESVQASFDHVVLTNESTRFTLTKNSGEYRVRMEHISADPAPEFAEVRLGLVTGSHHMQVFWVPGGEGQGNLQVGFPFTWLIPEKRWVPRNSTFVRPPDLEHQPEMWNGVCSRCHATGVEPHVNATLHRVDTKVGELGIACEACHGPAEKHVKIQLTAANGGNNPKKVQTGEIVHPKKISAERSTQICGFCHSMKWFDRSSGWPNEGFSYRPGDDLERTTPIIRPAHAAEIPRLAEYLQRNPDILQDFFWPDGMIRVSGRDFNGVIESPCYKSGKFSCLSCHSLHESQPEGQLSEKGKANTACTQCHEKFRDAPGLAAHTHHLASSTGSECYNCHMPHTTYGVLKAIRSHQISSPRVADDLASGRPNACNLCHLDKSLAWTADHLERWYGQKAPDLPQISSNISHIVHLALSGDAGQRVLAAWHLGWEPALRASQTNWVLPLLGQLMDDPYAAVRCVAVRSVRRISPIVPPDYDFTVDPNARQSVREAWATLRSQPKTIGEEAERGGLQLPVAAEIYNQLLNQRDVRPVRLRE